MEFQTTARYSDVSEFNDGFATYYDWLEHTWKILDKGGHETKVKGNYSEISRFGDGLARVQSAETNLYGFINTSGEEIVPCKYLDASSFSEGLARVEDSDELYGAIDKTGKEVIPCKYGYLTKFENGVAVVTCYGRHSGIGVDKYNLIDTRGKIICSEWYDEIYNFNGEVAQVELSAKGKNFVNKQNGELVGEWFQKACYFHDGLAAVQDVKTNLWGYVDTAGKLVIPCKYDSADPFIDGFSYVYNGSNSIWIDKNGNELSSDPRKIKKDFISVPVNFEGKAGYIYCDSTGYILIKRIYGKIGKYQEGLAAVKSLEDDLWGFVDREGRQVVPSKYKTVDDFENGLAIVTGENDLKTVIDGEGREIIPFVYDIEHDRSERVFYVKNKYDDITGFIDEHGNTIKDLSAVAFFYTFKFEHVEKELIAATEEDLRILVAAELEKYAQELKGVEVEDKTPQKTIGVYPGTEQPKV